MKEKWFQLPLSGYVLRVGFYAFLIHSSTHSEVVFCTTSVYLSPCTRVYVRGLSPSGRIFQIPTLWSNMITQIPKWYLWYLSDMSWRLFYAGMPYSMWRKIRVTVCHRLHQRRAILANRDIQRDIFPPIYHGLWHSLPPPIYRLALMVRTPWKLRWQEPVIGHGVLAGKYLAEYRDLLK